MYQPSYFNWGGLLKDVGAIGGGLLAGGPAGAAAAAGAILAKQAAGGNTATASVPPQAVSVPTSTVHPVVVTPGAGPVALPVDYTPATNYPTYGTGTAMPPPSMPVPSTNGSVSSHGPLVSDVEVKTYADGSVVYRRVRRRRRRRMLTASDRADIAFLQGVLSPAVAKGAITAMLSRRT